MQTPTMTRAAAGLRKSLFKSLKYLKHFLHVNLLCNVVNSASIENSIAKSVEKSMRKMTFGQKYNLDKVKRKMIFEKTVFYDILYLTYIIHSCAVNNIG